MSHVENTGIVNVYFTSRASRTVAKEIERRLYQAGASEVFMRADRAGLKFITLGDPWSEALIVNTLQQGLPGMIDQLSYNYGNGLLQTPLLFHLCPIPPTQQLSEISNAIREIHGVKSPQWLSGLTLQEDFDPSTQLCGFLEVHFEISCWPDVLLEARHKVIGLLRGRANSYPALLPIAI